MSNGHRQWLAGELPGLLANGVLNEDSSENLRKHFKLDELAAEPRSASKMTLILAALGGLLIGGGIIMIFAHNWDQIARSTRMGLALLPLIIAQIFALMALFPKQRGIAWREATAAFMFCAVPASIALVGQTYHISSDFQSFQTLWFLLMLPFIYLLKAKLTALLAMMLAAWMAGLYQGNYWLCALALLPFHFLPEPIGRHQANPALGWLFALGFSLSIIMGDFWSAHSQGTLIIWLMSGALAVYLIGSFTEPRNGFWLRPFSNIGALSVAINLLVYTFEDIWTLNRLDIGLSIGAVLTSHLTLLAFAVMGLAWAFISKRADVLPLSGAALFAIVVAIVPSTGWQPLGFVFAANLIFLCLGIWYLWLGINAKSTSRMNFGLLIILVVILMRFFDQDFSFIVKGAAFIVMGAAFIGVNLWQHRASSEHRINT